MITHVVLMKFTDPADRDEARRRLEELRDQIEQIRSLTVGLDLVGSPASFDLCLTTTHNSIEDLKGYQSHPAHEEFAAGWLRPRLSARAVVDFE